MEVVNYGKIGGHQLDKQNDYQFNVVFMITKKKTRFKAKCEYRDLNF
jgi:hypothetical protein